MGKLNDLVQRICGNRAESVMQFIKFGLVGVSNTLIAYAVEMLCYYIVFKNAGFDGIVSALGRMGVSASSDQVRVVVVTALAFIVSVTNSYFWNNRYVFSSEEKKTAKQHVRTYFRTVSCYAVTGLILSPILKILLSNYGVPYWVASFASLVVTIPLNFIMNKFWAFAKKQGQ